MLKCRYCIGDATEGICFGCRAKFKALEDENAMLKKDIAYLRKLAAAHHRETRADIARKMSKDK